MVCLIPMNSGKATRTVRVFNPRRAKSWALRMAHSREGFASLGVLFPAVTRSALLCRPQPPARTAQQRRHPFLRPRTARGIDASTPTRRVS